MRSWRERADAQKLVGIIPEEVSVVLRINAGRASKNNRSNSERRRGAGAAVGNGECARYASGQRKLPECRVARRTSGQQRVSGSAWCGKRHIAGAVAKQDVVCRQRGKASATERCWYGLKADNAAGF